MLEYTGKRKTFLKMHDFAEGLHRTTIRASLSSTFRREEAEGSNRFRTITLRTKFGLHVQASGHSTRYSQCIRKHIFLLPYLSYTKVIEKQIITDRQKNYRTNTGEREKNRSARSHQGCKSASTLPDTAPSSPVGCAQSVPDPVTPVSGPPDIA